METYSSGQSHRSNSPRHKSQQSPGKKTVFFFFYFFNLFIHFEYVTYVASRLRSFLWTGVVSLSRGVSHADGSPDL